MSAVGRLPRWARFAALIVVWVLIYVVLVHRSWIALGLITAAGLGLAYLFGATADRARTLPARIVAMLTWAGGSLAGMIALCFLLLVVATIGAMLGLWGSPWDGR